MSMTASIVFFFQAEDGIRDKLVTGVQTCALPISQLDLDALGLQRAVPAETGRPGYDSGRSPAALPVRLPARHPLGSMTGTRDVPERRADVAAVAAHAGLLNHPGLPPRPPPGPQEGGP